MNKNILRRTQDRHTPFYIVQNKKVATIRRKCFSDIGYDLLRLVHTA